MTTPTLSELQAALGYLETDVSDFAKIVNQASGTVTTRLGNTVDTVSKVLSEIRANAPFQPPVAFASGLTVNNNSFTVVYDGNTYAANSAAVPFTTTGTFVPSEWTLIINAGTGGGGGSPASVLISGAAGDGVTDDRTAFVTADGLSDNDYIHVPKGTYRIGSALTLAKPLYFDPGAQLVPDAGVNVHLTAGFFAGLKDHCFDISASGSSVTGDTTVMGWTSVFHFGAQPNTTNTSGAGPDSRAAFAAAIRYATLSPIRDEYAFGIPVKVPALAGGAYYRLSEYVSVNRTIIIEGEHPPNKGTGAIWIKPDDGAKCAFFVAYPGGLSAPDTYEPPDHATLGKYGGLRSQIKRLQFAPVTLGAVPAGIIFNALCVIEDCNAQEFGTVGFYGHAQTSGILDFKVDPSGKDHPSGIDAGTGLGEMFGNVNSAVLRNCSARLMVNANGYGAAGIAIRGNNGGIVHLEHCDASQNDGCGVLDNTTIGINIYRQHTAQNSWKIEHGGTRYLCIKPHVSSSLTEPGVGANWRTYWSVAATATTTDANWVTSTFYWPCCGINVLDAQATTYISGGYSEGGIELGYILRGACVAIGGVGARTRVVNHPEGYTARAIATTSDVQSDSYLKWAGGAIDSDITWTIDFGNYSKVVPTLMQFNYSEDSNDWKLTYSTSRKTWQWQYDNKIMMEYAGDRFDNDNVQGPAIVFPNGIVMGDHSSSVAKNRRLFRVYNFAAITGTIKQGDIFLFNVVFPGGYIGAVCTSDGVAVAGTNLFQFGAIASS